MAEQEGPFEPRWLYHPERPAELVETREAYEALMVQGTWADSPTVFGIITTPNREQAILQRPVSGDAAGGSMTTTEVLTLHLNSKVEALEAQVVTLQGQGAKVETLESEIETLHGILKAVQDDYSRLIAQVQELGKPSRTTGPAPEKK